MSESNSKATIPQPREGALGEWDKYVGPAASGWENAGTFGFAAVGAVAAPALVRRSAASGLCTAWLAGSSILAPPPSGYAWLPALLGFKILLGHGTPRGPLSGLRHRRRLRRG